LKPIKPKQLQQRDNPVLIKNSSKKLFSSTIKPTSAKTTLHGFTPLTWLRSYTEYTQTIAVRHCNCFSAMQSCGYIACFNLLLAMPTAHTWLSAMCHYDKFIFMHSALQRARYCLDQKHLSRSQALHNYSDFKN
ncbi:MAG: hypothetical protein RLZZ419_1566, partial [Pseudomonadota bacterium]